MIDWTKKGRDRDPYEVARRRMVSDQLASKGIASKDVLHVMGELPRHLFVEHAMESQAYLDRPLPLGLGQTISQPFIVAKMTETLQLTGTEKVLEIGTGSGYQAAVLAGLAKEVYSVERLSDLSIRARKVLYRLGYKNIKLRIGDGTLGWKENAPYDRIIVTAGGPKIPESLLHQLVDGGTMIIPVGHEDIQCLEVIQRIGNRFEQKRAIPCRFVKLKGQHGW